MTLDDEKPSAKIYKLVHWPMENRRIKIVYDMKSTDSYSCYVGAGDMDCSKWGNGPRHFAQFILK